MKSFLILSLLIPSIAVAAPIKGASYIGICNPNFPCQQALEVFKDQEVKALGYLADAFGHECQCVKDFLGLPGRKYIRVHLANGTCFPERGRKCGRYDVFHNETKASAQRKLLRGDKRILSRFNASIARTLALVGNASANVTVRYSVCLECPISNKARARLIDEASKYIPKDQLVDSPVGFPCLNNVICEKHGDSMRYKREQRCISDTDGISMFDANLTRLNLRSDSCEAIFYWTNGFNLIPYGYAGKFIEPYKRVKKPQRWEFNGLAACIR